MSLSWSWDGLPFFVYSYIKFVIIVIFLSFSRLFPVTISPAKFTNWLFKAWFPMIFINDSLPNKRCIRSRIVPTAESFAIPMIGSRSSSPRVPFAPCLITYTASVRNKDEATFSCDITVWLQSWSHRVHVVEGCKFKTRCKSRWSPAFSISW